MEKRVEARNVIEPSDVRQTANRFRLAAFIVDLERATGFEPATKSLGSSYSTN